MKRRKAHIVNIYSWIVSHTLACTLVILHIYNHIHTYEPTQTVQNVIRQPWLAFNKQTGLYFEDTFSYPCYSTFQLETIKMLAVYFTQSMSLGQNTKFKAIIVLIKYLLLQFMCCLDISWLLFERIRLKIAWTIIFTSFMMYK